MSGLHNKGFGDLEVSGADTGFISRRIWQVVAQAYNPGSGGALPPAESRGKALLKLVAFKPLHDQKRGKSSPFLLILGKQQTSHEGTGIVGLTETNKT